MTNTITPAVDSSNTSVSSVSDALDTVLATAAKDSALEYSRAELMAARALVLSVKRTARQGGYGQVAGRMIRETVGYKFDSMPVDDVLKAMEADGFLAAYATELDQWYASLSPSATEATLHRNANLYKAASSLTKDEHSFKTLVKALRLLCIRNQDWRESGNNLSLTMNGHKAVLDLFCINVTNARRLSLSAE